MSALINLHGKRFGRLRVLDRGKTVTREFGEGSVVYWMCKCDCGTVHEVRSRDLRCGRTRSCGCLRAELTWGWPTYRTASLSAAASLLPQA